MRTCGQCGKSIEFRYMGGLCRPLGCKCNGSSGRGVTDHSGYDRSDESCCYPTTCPKCGDEVYFIRHNGGSVWINSPLGWPWPKHGCMDVSAPSSKGARSTLAMEFGIKSSVQADGQLIGIVREGETSISGKSTLLDIEFGGQPNVVLLMKNNARFLVGKLVLHDQAKKSLSWIEENKYAFQVVAELSQTAKLVVMNAVQVICPECMSAVKLFDLHRHLKQMHGLPYRLFSSMNVETKGALP